MTAECGAQDTPSTSSTSFPTGGTLSLYVRLGGIYNIATVVDDFIDRILGDARLNTNPHVDEAHHRVSPSGFKHLVTEMVSSATGGPQWYAGRAMGNNHRHLMITDVEWQAFMDAGADVTAP